MKELVRHNRLWLLIRLKMLCMNVPNRTAFNSTETLPRAHLI